MIQTSRTGQPVLRIHRQQMTPSVLVQYPWVSSAAAQDFFPFQTSGFQGVVADQPTEITAAVGGGVGARGLGLGKRLEGKRLDMR